MDLTGRYLIPASPEVVWSAIQDPAVLKACIPGCEEIEKTGDSDFTAKATLKIGPVKATFRGKVTLSEMEPPHRCILKGEGQGGVAGFAKGEAEVLLTPEGDATVLVYTAKASVGGKLAQIGQRLIDGAARQIADDFFARFARTVAPQPVAESDAQAGVSPATASAEAAGFASVEAAPEELPKRAGLSPAVWGVGLVAVIAALLFLAL